MGPFKIIFILFGAMLASCHHEVADKVVTPNITFGIKPNQGPIEDTSRYTICGTMMGEKLNLNFDPDFSVFWEAFSKDLSKRDFASLAQKTRFPLSYSTGNGQDTSFIYEKKGFKPVFSKFISADINGQTRFDRLKGRSSSSYVPLDQESVIIEGLVFEKIHGDWCLSALSD